MADVLLFVLCLWALWALCNLVLMAAFSSLGYSDAARFDGFRVHIPEWMKTALTERELRAFRQHEEGHRARMHVWSNFARVCFFIGMTPATRRRQEHEADDFCDDPAALASGIRKTSNHAFDLARAARLETRALVEEGPAGRRRPNPRDAGSKKEGEAKC